MLESYQKQARCLFHKEWFLLWGVGVGHLTRAYFRAVLNWTQDIN
ncbi:MULTISPECIES: hypothetical protein [unclassified Microcoleus]